MLDKVLKFFRTFSVPSISLPAPQPALTRDVLNGTRTPEDYFISVMTVGHCTSLVVRRDIQHWIASLISDAEDIPTIERKVVYRSHGFFDMSHGAFLEHVRTEFAYDEFKFFDFLRDPFEEIPLPTGTLFRIGDKSTLERVRACWEPLLGHDPADPHNISGIVQRVVQSMQTMEAENAGM